MEILKRYTKTLSDKFQGEWFRASEYELVSTVAGNDRVIESIMPTREAEIEPVNPWDKYHAPLTVGERKSGVIERPYSVLLRLGFEILKAEGAGPIKELNQTSKLFVTEWVSRNGLLGILNAGAGLILLPAGDLQVIEPRVRSAGHWDIGEPAYIFGYPDVVRNGLSAIRSTWGVDISRPDQALRPYFPGQDPVVDLSCWGNSFQRLYAEPLTSIASEAFTFFFVAVNLCRKDKRDGLLSFMADRARTAAPRFEMKEGRVTYVHASPSLLSSYSLMFLWDLIEGLTAAQCKSCETPYIRNSDRVAYCSGKCRRREKTRRVRRRAKSAAENDKGGK